MAVLRAMALALALLCGRVEAETVVLYSSKDTGAAMVAYRLARMWGPAFIAPVNLMPGVPWKPKIAAAICAAERVMVLWSEHAAASPYVADEVATAVACERRMFPVMLDSTPLPPALSGVHAVDLRGLFGTGY